MLRGLLLCLALLSAAQSRADDFNYVIRSDELAYSGLITPASVKIFTDYLEGGGARIVINSRGGDSAAGLAIAQAMEKHPVELVVDRYCLSACANFLFIGARSKSLRPGALLGFHGDVLGLPLPAILMNKSNAPLASDGELREYNAKVSRLYAAEEAYFRGIGVDPAFFALSTMVDPADQPHFIDIISDGKVVRRFDLAQAAEANSLMDALRKKTGNAGWNVGLVSLSQKMYFPGPATLAHFGIHGIGAYPYPSGKAQLLALTRSLAAGEGLDGLETYGDF